MTAPNVTVRITADYKSAEQAGKAFLAKLDRDMKFEAASIKEALAEGLVTPLQAAQREADLLKQKNVAILAEIRRAGDAGQLGGQGGQAYYTTVASGLQRIAADAPKATAAVRQVGQAASGTSSTIESLIFTFNGLAASAVGIPQSVGTLASRLLPFAVGGAVTAAVLAGVTVLGTAWEVFGGKAKKAAEDAAEATRQATASIREMQNAGDFAGLQDRAFRLFEGSAAKSFRDGIRFLEGQILGEMARQEQADRTKNLAEYLQAKRRIGELRAELLPLRLEFDRVQAAILGPAPAVQRRREAIVTSAESERATRSADRAIERENARLTRFGDAVDAFAIKVRTQFGALSDDVAVGLARTLATLNEEFEQLGRRGPIPDDVAAQYRAATESLERQIVATREAARTQAEYEAGLDRASRATTGALDDIGQALAQIRAGVGPDGLSVLADPDATVRDLVAMQRTLEQIVGTAALDADTKARARTLLEQILALQDQIETSGARGLQRQAESTSALAASLAELAAGARGLLDAAQAAGILDANLSSAITSALNLAQALPKALAGDVGGVLGTAAALLNLGAQAFGQDRAEVERRRVLEANTSAIERLTARAGDLAAFAGSGASIGATGRGVAEVVRLLAAGGVRDKGRVTGADRTLSAAGSSMAEVEALARQLGITLDGTAGAWRALDAALAASDLRAFVDSWEGALAELDVLLDVDRVESPLGRLVAFADRLTGAAGSPYLSGLLRGVDLSTAGGRADARERARAALDRFREGAVPADALGSLSPSAFLAAIQRFIREIDAVGDGAAVAVDPLARLSQRLSDIAAASRLLGTGTADEIRETLDALGEAFPAFAAELVGVLQGVDLTTQGGIDEVRARLRTLTQRLLVDGLSDTERELLSALVEILGRAEAAFGEAQAAATAGTDAVVGFAEAAQAAAEELVTAADRLDRATVDARRMGVDPTFTPVLQAGAFRDDPTLRRLLGGRGLDFDARDRQQVDAVIAYVRTQYPALAGDDRDAVGTFLDFLLEQQERLAVAAADGAAAVQRDALADAARNAPPVAQIRGDVLQLTEATGSALASIAQSQLATLVGLRTDVQEATAALVGALAGRGPILPPALPARALGAGGELTVRLQAELRLIGEGAAVESFLGSRAGLSQELEREFTTLLDRVGSRWFAERLIGLRLAAGDITA